MKDSTSRKIIKIISFLLCFALLFTSCKNVDDEGGATTVEPGDDAVEIPGGSLSVPYLRSDSLNPFFMNTVQNSALVSLYCRGLYYLDGGYDAVRDIALSEIVSAGSVKVNLDPTFVFSDGSAVTAQDVKYSFDYAKNAVLYSRQLRGVGSCTVTDDNTVLFELEYPDVNVLNALTFPVVKRGSATTDTSLPVSCGHYKFSQDGIRLTLVCNMEYAGDAPAVGTIRLTEVAEDAVLESLVDSGEIDFCYSDLGSGSVRKSYSFATDVYLNNFVFIGVNHKNVNFGIADMRRAMSMAIDRQEIVSAGFQGFARSASIPFNTSWVKLSDSKIAYDLSFYAENEKADDILSLFGGGSNGNACYVTMLCPDANSFLRNTAGVIVKQLAKNNIIVTVETVDERAYRKALSEGTYDLFLGEIKLISTMDLSAFFLEDGAVCYGFDPSKSPSAQKYFEYRSGEIELDDFLQTFSLELPFIPLCFRNGRLCYTTDISSTVGVSERRLFGDIDKWDIAERQ